VLDEVWAESHLLVDERSMWRTMPAADRRHAIEVARRFADRRPEASRAEMAGALLHDVGKVASGFGTFGRVVATVVGPRTARLFDVFGALVSSAFFGLMTWQYIRFSAEMASANESSPILRWPSAPWWWAVTALIAVATLAALWRCLVVTGQEK
jgi:hypothetical protein